MRLLTADRFETLAASLDPGEAAFADGEWIAPGPGGSVTGLVVAGGDDLVESAARALAGVAREACAVVEEAPPGSVAVTGRGLVATFVRSLLGPRLQADGAAARPWAVVETTGDAEVIAEATRRVGGLGTVVLAGEAAGRPIDLDLYPDAHVRGLHLVGIARAGTAEAAPAPVTAPPPEELAPGGEARAGAVWYRLTLR